VLHSEAFGGFSTPDNFDPLNRFDGSALLILRKFSQSGVHDFRNTIRSCSPPGGFGFGFHTFIFSSFAFG
jgi:hypothetical protein